MSSRNSVFASGAIAAAIAVVLIVGVVTTGILNTKSTATGETSSTSSSGSGVLAVLLTDPPTVPNGTSAVFIDYSALAVHVSGAANDSGWHVLNGQGEINLMSIINVTQTIATANIQSGDFDELAFNVTSATVTFLGANYSAYLVYEDHRLVVPIVGGITIANGQTSAAVIDLTPTVLLLGDPSDPVFAFIPAARGYTIPAQSIPSTQVGQTGSVANETWFKNNQPAFEIMGATLTPNSLSITVANIGNVSLVFTLTAVTSLSSLAGGLKPTLPSVASISEYFVIYPNTSMIPITKVDERSITRALASAGYELPPAASVTFKYSDPITIGIVQGVTKQPVQSVVPGQRYVISITSSDKLAQTLVMAGGLSPAAPATQTTTTQTTSDAPVPSNT